MIRHIVAWKLTAEDAEGKAASIAEIAGLLEPLVGEIDGLTALKVHANSAYFDVNFDVVLIADYPTLADLEAYQVHPAHVKAAAVVREHVSQRASVDFEI